MTGPAPRLPALPAGYVSFRVGNVDVVSADGYVEPIMMALKSRARTLHDYARLHFESTALAGRGTAYAAPLPDETRVVVRHNWHGGVFAPLTRDLFLAPTRAPLELEMSARLTQAAIPTPEMIAYALYPAPLGFRRADVVTREVAASFDLSFVLTRSNLSLRAHAWEAVAVLLGQLAGAGARHHDLNVKNVLLRPRGAELEAVVLDVDRVSFEAGDVMSANLARLSRSARKWRDRHGARVEEGELTSLARSALDSADPASTRS